MSSPRGSGSYFGTFPSSVALGNNVHGVATNQAGAMIIHTEHYGVNPNTNNLPLEFSTNLSNASHESSMIQTAEPENVIETANYGGGGFIGGGEGWNSSWAGPGAEGGAMGDFRGATTPPPLQFNMMPAPLPPPLSQEIVHSPSCSLYPPQPGTICTPRERPPGCKTIFIGGLPASVTEDLIREVFSKCGVIISIRMSKKNFCHIRFEDESCVDRAIKYSGYRMILGRSNEKENDGRLHVDYAEAWDDQYEYECRQRQLQRELRHRQKLEEQQQTTRSPSPPSVVHYSDHEAFAIAEHLKGNSSFPNAAKTVAAWMERGECNKRTSNTFYGMLQSVNSHVRRLSNEKQLYIEEMSNLRQQHQQRMNDLLSQFERILAVLTAACKQKARDHFTKAQRKNIDAWHKQAEEIRENHLKDMVSERNEVDMEVSDTEEETHDPPPNKKMRTSEVEVLNSSLEYQLEAYKKEVEMLKMELKTGQDHKDMQINGLKHALHGLQQRILEGNIKETENNESKNDSINNKEEITEKEEVPTYKTAQPDAVTQATDATADLPNDTDLADQNEDTVYISPQETLLVGLLATFLHVHPFGASVEYLQSYLQRLNSQTTAQELEELMTKLPVVFKQELSGVGATLEKRWKFCAFEHCLNSQLERSDLDHT